MMDSKLQFFGPTVAKLLRIRDWSGWHSDVNDVAGYDAEKRQAGIENLDTLERLHGPQIVHQAILGSMVSGREQEAGAMSGCKGEAQIRRHDAVVPDICNKPGGQGKGDES